MVELLLARHGLAHCNMAGIVGGPRGCTGLTGRGREQVALLSTRLQREAAEGQPMTGIYASPRRRSRETAEFIADEMRLPVNYDDRLTEMDLGPNADGRSWSDIRAELSLRPTEFPDARLDGEGETWSEHVRRVVGALSAVVAECSVGRQLVIGHSETVLAALHLFLGVPPEGRLPFDCAMDHAALTIWRLDEPPGRSARWALVRHNDVSHLVGRTVVAPASG